MSVETVAAEEQWDFDESLLAETVHSVCVLRRNSEHWAVYTTLVLPRGEVEGIEGRCALNACELRTSDWRYRR